MDTFYTWFEEKELAATKEKYILSHLSDTKLTLDLTRNHFILAFEICLIMYLIETFGLNNST